MAERVAALAPNRRRARLLHERRAEAIESAAKRAGGSIRT
jgi:hypothetical protein